MAYYLGMDVSQKMTALCVVDDKGLIVAEGKALTIPQDILNWLTTKKIALSLRGDGRDSDRVVAYDGKVKHIVPSIAALPF